jgi:hypothetical protein
MCMCDTSGVNTAASYEKQQDRAIRKDVKVVMVSYKELSYEECYLIMLCSLVHNRKFGEVHCLHG